MNLLKNNRIRYARYRKRLPVRKGTVLLLADADGACVDSPFYLMRHLLQATDLEVFTASRDPQRTRRRLAAYGMHPTVVAWESREFPQLLATAEYLVTNAALPTYVVKRPGQVLLNTWHGTPLKTLGYDMKTPWAEIAATQAQFVMADYLLYPNEDAMERIMGSYFLDALYAHDAMLCGYPRTEAFFDEARRAELRRFLGIEGLRVFAYLPTWRGAGVHALDVQRESQVLGRDLAELDELLDDDVIVLVKAHRFSSGAAIPEHLKHVVVFDGELETYDVVNACDGLLTDYSSVMYDYAVTGRPIVLFPYDLDEYVASRGVYEDVRDLPFPIARTLAEVAEYLNGWEGELAHPEEYAAFARRYCAYDAPDNAAACASMLLGAREARRVGASESRGADGPLPAHLKAFKGSGPWRVILADGIFESAEGRSLLENGLGEHDLLVFSGPSFTSDRESRLRAAQVRCPILIAPGQAPVTLFDYAETRLYEKTGRASRRAVRAFALDLERVFPGLEIGEVVDFSGRDTIGSLKWLAAGKPGV